MKKQLMAFVVSFALVSTAFASAASAAKCWSYPKRTDQYGTSDYFFINATNGDQFCNEEGYSEMYYGTILCGEDESGYSTYDWSSQRWVYESTGSKNMCYPLFRYICCR